MRRYAGRRCLLSVVCVAGALLGVSPARAETLPVTSSANDGPGTLRDQIDAANVSFGEPDTITFALPGAGPHVIELDDPLPDLFDAPSSPLASL